MLHLSLCIIAILATPNAYIYFLLTLKKHFIVDVMKVWSSKNLHTVILENRFDNTLRPRYILLLISCCLRIVNTVLVECFNVFIDVS